MPDDKSKKSTMPAYYSLITASLGTVMQYVFVHPIWSAKISAQSTDGSDPIKFRLKNLPLLYRGFLLHVARAMPAAGVQVCVGNAINDLVPNKKENVRLLYAGFIGGVASAPLVTVTDIVMMQQKRLGGNAKQQYKTIVDNKGVRGLLTGLPSTAIRNGGRTVSYFAIFPGVHHHLYTYMQTQYSASSSQKTVVANIGATAAAGLFATFVTNPPDVIKTIQQNNVLNPKMKESMSIIAAAINVYNSKGVKGFFSGTGHRLISRCIESFVMGHSLKHIPKLLDQATGNSYSESTQSTYKSFG